MAYLIKNVPYCAQPNKKDCWYTALKMIRKYHKSADPGSMPKRDPEGFTKKLHKAVQGLDNDFFNEFAEENGLTKAEVRRKERPPVESGKYGVVKGPMGDWTVKQLEKLLKTHGPLWVAYSAAGYAHIIVLIGVKDDDNVIYHDPQITESMETSLDNFNKLLNPTAPFQIAYYKKEKDKTCIMM